MTKSSESVPSGLEPDPDSRLPGFGPPLVSIGLATFSAFGGELKNPAKNESFLSKIITLGSTILATWELTVRRCSLS